MPFIQDLFIQEFIPCLRFRNTRKDKLLLYNMKFIQGRRYAVCGFWKYGHIILGIYDCLLLLLLLLLFRYSKEPGHLFILNGLTEIP